MAVNIGGVNDLLRGCNNVYLLSQFLPFGADPTAYTAYLSVCTYPSKPITNATNAIPIVITSASHGLTTGNKIAVVNVGGNGAAKGTFSVTVIDANTFSLDGSAGSGAYTRGGEWFLALPDACGLAFSGTPPQITIPGSLGLDGSAYVLVMTVLGANRDTMNAINYVAAVDRSA
jgi:hypothetical protein